jgi:hypothetical protein
MERRVLELENRAAAAEAAEVDLDPKIKPLTLNP